MLTNPSTLGLFDEHIEEVSAIFHDAGALLYYDGANLNAVCGISRPGDMGFDIVHINLHKTFSQPHGGGGPGGGPIAVRDILEPFLPVPAVVRDGETFRLDHDRPKTIGKVRGFCGPFGVFVRSYAFIRAYGPALREMSEVAVLNANYLLARLRDVYDLPFDRLCMHEFVLSARNLKRDHGITALDVAKGLMDRRVPPADHLLPADRARGAHDRADRDRGEGDPRRVRRGDARDRRRGGHRPAGVEGGAHRRPVRRLDEVKAAKRAIVKYGFDEHPGYDARRSRGRADRGAEGRVSAAKQEIGARVDELAEARRGQVRRRGRAAGGRAGPGRQGCAPGGASRASRRRGGAPAGRSEALRREGLDTPDPRADRGALAG